MKIKKVVSNNMVYAYDDVGHEVIVVGNGIGFGKSCGGIVEKARIEKEFRLSDEKMSQFERMVKEIPERCIDTSERIISYAKEVMGEIEINDNIYIALTDHLNFAIERYQKGISFQNGLLWEIKRYYPKEFSIGKKAIEMIYEDMGVELPEDEAGFFALHVVNAEIQGDSNQGMEMPAITKDIVSMVSYTLGTNIEERGISFDRFVTHVKFFLQRVVSNKECVSKDIPWAAEIKSSYPLAYKCALRIESYMRAKLHYDISEEEITYLTLHIQRLKERE